MRRLLVLFFILSSSVCYAAGWGESVQKTIPGGSQQQQNISGTSQSGDGSITTVNVGDTRGQAQQAEKVNYGNKFVESDISFDADGLLIMFAAQPSDRQIVLDGLILGATYKFSEAIHIFIKAQQFQVEGTTMIDPDDMQYYRDAYAEDASTDVEQPEAEATLWSHQHVFFGFGFRTNVRETNDSIHQMQVNLGWGLLSEVVEENSGKKVDGLQPGALLEVKYLVSRDNWQYGFIMSMSEIKSEAEEYKDYMPGGVMYMGFTIQVGIMNL